MGLDISFKLKEPIVCPHCGQVVGYNIIESAYSDGRAWSDWLETIGGDTPYKGFGEDRYGQDYILTQDEVSSLCEFIKGPQKRYLTNVKDIVNICFNANEHKRVIEINADW